MASIGVQTGAHSSQSAPNDVKPQPEFTGFNKTVLDPPFLSFRHVLSNLLIPSNPHINNVKAAHVCAKLFDIFLKQWYTKDETVKTMMEPVPTAMARPVTLRMA
jgi:hypothetical protein